MSDQANRMGMMAADAPYIGADEWARRKAHEAAAGETQTPHEHCTADAAIAEANASEKPANTVRSHDGQRMSNSPPSSVREG